MTPHAAEHRLRAELAVPNIRITADLPAWDTDDEGEIRQLEPGLFRLALRSTRSDRHAALGHEAGHRAAAHAGHREPPSVAVTGGSYPAALHTAPVFIRGDGGCLQLPALAFPSFGACDVAVAGGGTGGAPAGIAAAREGARTIVLETQHALGGIGTLGLITIYYWGNRIGFTRELDEAVMTVDANAREHRGQQWRPEIKAAVYARLLADAGGDAWFGSFACGVRRDGNRVVALLVSTPYGCGLLTAGCVVDATGNADVAAAAGATCRVIGTEHVATQGTGLSPRVEAGTWRQNSDFTFVDETDPEGITAAFVLARAKRPEAFDNTPLVDSRERRQIVGDLELSPLDILAKRTFPDTICTANSNFDTHGFTVHTLFMVVPPDEASLDAHVPFRCLLPQNLDGVLTTGLGVSAHRDALPVIRMQADVQNQGFAAGLAAAWSAAEGIPLRDLDVRALQERLVAIGNLAPDVPRHTDSFPLTPEAIAAAAKNDLTSLQAAAVLLAHPDAARPLLREQLAAGRPGAALLLGMLGCPDAAPELAKALQARAWDEGWNYRGMGQFGLSMSPIDALMLALARTGDPQAVEPICEKIRALDETAAFSHCRAVALATALLSDSILAKALADLLALPGMTGHAHRNIGTLTTVADDDLVVTAPRNRALRELYLARGLFLAGDVDGIGERLLKSYTHDLRGHFARHAKAVLASDTAPRDSA